MSLWCVIGILDIAYSIFLQTFCLVLHSKMYREALLFPFVCTVCSSIRRTKPSRGGRPRTQERRADGEHYTPSFVPDPDPDPT